MPLEYYFLEENEIVGFKGLSSSAIKVRHQTELLFYGPKKTEYSRCEFLEAKLKHSSWEIARLLSENLASKLQPQNSLSSDFKFSLKSLRAAQAREVFAAARIRILTQQNIHLQAQMANSQAQIENHLFKMEGRCRSSAVNKTYETSNLPTRVPCINYKMASIASYELREKVIHLL